METPDQPNYSVLTFRKCHQIQATFRWMQLIMEVILSHSLLTSVPLIRMFMLHRTR